jgi:hypothetical protein
VVLQKKRKLIVDLRETMETQSLQNKTLETNLEQKRKQAFS